MVICEKGGFRSIPLRDCKKRKHGRMQVQKSLIFKPARASSDFFFKMICIISQHISGNNLAIFPEQLI